MPWLKLFGANITDRITQGVTVRKLLRKKSTPKKPDDIFGLSSDVFANLIGMKKSALAQPKVTPSYLLDDVPGDLEKNYAIKALTAAQEAKLVEFYNEWLAIGLSTAAADRVAAEEGIRRIYDTVERKPPQIAWMPSPMKGVIASAFQAIDLVTSDVFDEALKKARDVVQATIAPPALLKIRQAILDPIGDRLADVVPLVGVELSNRVAALKMDGAEEVVQRTIQDACFGCHDAAWMGFYDYCRRVVGLDLSYLEGLMQVARSGGWFWPMKASVIITDRPNTIRLDDKNKLHAVDGRAVEYADGFGLCAWHGRRVPEAAILAPDEVEWKDVESLADKDLREALAEIKALKWSGGDEESENFAAALAAKRLGGVEAVKDLTEDEK